MGNHRALKIIILGLAVSVCWLGFVAQVSAVDYDYQLQDIMNGNVPDVAVLVKGNGPYYGDSIRVTFSNYSGQNHTIHVPIGFQLVPANSGVQTMLTAGGENLSIPTGQSSYTIKAFCGEMHDSGPGTSDTFTAGGFVDGDTLRTLQEINRQKSFNRDGQQAVWHHTDANDITGNETAEGLAGGGGVSPGTAAVAGGATAGLAVVVTILTNLLGGSGAAAGVNVGDEIPPEDEFSDEGDDEGDDEEDDEEDDPVALPDDEYGEYPPPEDDELYERPPVDPDEELPDNLKPPIEIAEIPPPENPGDGIQIASADEGPGEWLWNIYLEGRNRDVPVPDKLPPHMTPDKDQSVWDWFWGLFRNPPTPENDPNALEGGRRIRENAPLGSASEINKALSDPERYSRTGEGDPAEFLRQVKRERVEIGGSDGLAKLRRIEKLRSLLNAKSGTGGTTRDLSGITEYLRDFAEPDVKDWVHNKIPVYQYDDAGHQAMEQYQDAHGSMPDESNPEQLQEFMQMYNQLKGK